MKGVATRAVRLAGACLLASGATFFIGVGIGLALEDVDPKWERAALILGLAFLASSVLHARGGEWWTRNVKVLSENAAVLAVGLLLSLSVLLFS